MLNDLGESKLKEMKLCIGRLRLKLKREKNATTKKEKKEKKVKKEKKEKEEKKEEKKEKKEKEEKKEKKESVQNVNLVAENADAEKKQPVSDVAAAAHFLGYYLFLLETLCVLD